ncbi:MAG: PhnD/SsuA/transferrin family substrate-binding protein [Thermodesulfobacteriota bacterium]
MEAEHPAAPSPALHLTARPRTLLFSLLALLCLLPAVSFGAAANRIAVLTVLSPEETMRAWNPTAAWLESRIPGQRFQILPMAHQEIEQAVAAKEVEFVLTGPQPYVVLRAQYNLSAIASRIALINGRPVTHYGGVIFTRADRPDILSLADLQGRKIAAVDGISTAGYLVQRWTLLKAGIDISQDASMQFVGLPQSEVVAAVLKGRADAGFVRTGLLEGMARKGTLRLDQIRVLNRQPDSLYPQLLSTDLYPEFPFAAMPHVPEPLVKRVTIALLSLPSDSPAAAAGGYYGFAPPANFTEVEALMVRLGLHPYRKDFGWQEVFDRYAPVLLAVLMALLMAAGLVGRRLYRDRRLLRSEKNRWQTLFEHSGTGNFVVSADRRILAANHLFCSLFGYSPEEVIGQSTRILHLDQRHYDKWTPRHQEALEGASLLTPVEYPWRRKDGAIIWCSFFGARIDLPGGEKGLLWSVIDITARKETEVETLRRTKELAALNTLTREVSTSLSLERVIAAALEGLQHAAVADAALFFVRDGERLRLAGSAPAGGTIAAPGSMPEHRVGECLCGLAVGDGRPTYSADITSDPRCTWEECKKAGIRSFAALPLRSGEEVLGVVGLASCTARDFAAQAEFLETMAGAVATGFRNAQLFTETTQATSALRESEARYRALVESARSVIIQCDSAGTILFINDYGRELFGFADEELVGHNLVGTIVPATDSSGRDLGRMVREVCENPERFSDNENENITRDGRRLWIRWSNRVLHDGAGKVVGILSVGNDISEQRRLEGERLEMERRMQHVQKLESLGVLAGGIAHDFNNLLMAILGHADLALLDLAPMAPACKSLHEITKAAHRAADLCRQMLAYSGKGRFIIETIRLNELVTEMVHLLQTSISKKAQLHLALAEDLPPMEGDATQIRQVLMNLITNASDAIGDQNGVITLATGITDCTAECVTPLGEALPSGRYLFLEVSDTGCGMEQETVQRIFEPFFTTKFTGRGLGMSAVLGIVRGHKGTIRIYSEPGRGTTFKVLLPVADCPAEEEAVPARAAAGWQGDGCVLLVDDDAAVRSVGRSMLEKMGLTVVEAVDGRHALGVYSEEQGRIDLVLLDLTMPLMDGEEAFRELRRIDPNVLVVMASGYTAMEVMPRFAGKGLAGFIQKPFSFQELSTAIQAALAASPSR